MLAPARVLLEGAHPRILWRPPLLGLRAVDQHIVYIGRRVFLSTPMPDVALACASKVAQKHTLSQGAEGGCDVHRRRGLAHAAPSG